MSSIVALVEEEEEEPRLWDNAVQLLDYGREFIVASVGSAESLKDHSSRAYATDFAKEWFSRRVGNEKIKDSAKKHAIASGKGVPVISKEIVNSRVDPKDNGGKAKTVRKFLVWNWPSFLSWYSSKTPLVDRNYYENVFQGEPCRLYMDVEMECEAPLLEPSPLGQPLLQVTEEYEQRKRFVLDMIERTCEIVRETYGGKTVPTRVYFMDSSSAVKYSNHVVIHLDGDKTRFRSSSDVLNLVDYVNISCNLKLHELSSSSATGVAANWKAPKSFFQWSPSPGGSGSAGETRSKNVLDRSVYGKKGGGNEFRILGSTKVGKNRHITMNAIYDPIFDSETGGCVLLPSEIVRGKEAELMWDRFERHPVYEPAVHDPINWARFYETLVCYRPRGSTLDNLLTFEFSGREYHDRARALKKSERATESGTDQRRPLRRVNSEGDDDDYVENAEREMRREDLNGMPSELASSITSYLATVESDRAMLFDKIGAEIGDYYESKFDSDCVEVVAYRTSRSTNCHDARRTASFKTSCQWCDVKDDYHGSNHVYYVADLVSKTWWMRCWNEGCKSSVQTEKDRKRREYEANKAHRVVPGDGAKRMPPVLVFDVGVQKKNDERSALEEKDHHHHHRSYLDKADEILRERDASDDEEDEEEEEEEKKGTSAKAKACDFLGRALSTLDEGYKASCRGPSHDMDVSLWLDIQKYLKMERETVDSYLAWVARGRPLPQQLQQQQQHQTEKKEEEEEGLVAVEEKEEGLEEKAMAKTLKKTRTRCAKRSYVHLESERDEKRRLIETLI